MQTIENDTDEDGETFLRRLIVSEEVDNGCFQDEIDRRIPVIPITQCHMSGDRSRPGEPALARSIGRSEIAIKGMIAIAILETRSTWSTSMTR